MANIVPILMHHEINEGVTDKMHKSCYMSPSAFNEQMQYLSENEYNVLSASEIYSNKGLDNYNKPLIITFDDSHIGNYKYASKILHNYGMKATFFVTTDHVGRDNMMNWNNLREMRDLGMDIQSHSSTHTPFSTLKNSDIRTELVNSKSVIENELKTKVRLISLPHGDYDKRLEKIARDEGYKAIFTSCPKYYNTKRNPYFVGRLDIRSAYSTEIFKAVVTNNCNKLILGRILYEIKHFVKKIIGINNYRRVYRLINGITLEEEACVRFR